MWVINSIDKANNVPDADFVHFILATERVLIEVLIF